MKFCVLIIVGVVLSFSSDIDHLPSIEHIYTQEWRQYLEALSWVESRHNDTLNGKTNDAGRYQITPIYVKEVNRILRKNVYTLDDRYDRRKSEEMIFIMNRRYNKTFDINKAIALHNPKAGDDYKQKILNKISRIK
jgi:hypothetical protein